MIKKLACVALLLAMCASCSSIPDPGLAGSSSSGDTSQPPGATVEITQSPGAPSQLPPALDIDFDDIINTGADIMDLQKPDYANETRADTTEVLGNLLVNPGFEGDLDGWAMQTSGARIEIKANSEIVHSGEKSLLMSVDSYVNGTYPSIYQSFPVNPGDIIRCGAWVRTYGCSGGVGPYLAISYLDAGGNRISFDQSAWIMNGAVSEWVLLKAAGAAPDECVRISFQILFHGEGYAAYDDAFLTIESVPVFSEAEVPLVMRSESSVGKFLGFGAQGDLFLTTFTAMNYGIGSEDIERLSEYIGEMRLQCARLFFSYKWWEYDKGVRIDPKRNADLKNFLDLVLLYKEHDVEINLCPWGHTYAYSPWQLNPDNDRAPPDDAIVPTAQSLAALLKYLIIDLGCDNVKYVTLANEPDNDFVNYPFDAYRYKKSIKALDWALREEGIRDRLGIIGSDDCSPPLYAANVWFRRIVTEDVIPYFDYVGSHTYTHWFPTIPILTEWIRDRQSILRDVSPVREIPLMITEFGNGGEDTQHPPNETYDYGLFINAFAIEAVNSGVVQLCHWSLADACYDENTFSSWGMIRFKTENWSARPSWYSYSLLTRHTAVGDAAYAFDAPEGCNISATLFASESGEISVSLVNKGADVKTVVLATQGLTDRELLLYMYNKDTLPGDGHLIRATGTVFVENNGITVTVPGRSAVMLSER